MESNTGRIMATDGRSDRSDREKMIKRIHELVDGAEEKELHIILAALRAIRRI